MNATLNSQLHNPIRNFAWERGNRSSGTPMPRLPEPPRIDGLVSIAVIAMEAERRAWAFDLDAYYASERAEERL